MSQEIRDAAYDRNFIAKYGEIDPNQSWDLSKYASAPIDLTRATENGTGYNCAYNVDPSNWMYGHVTRESEWYYVDTELVEKFTDQLKEGQNNSALGNPFTLKSNGTFYIVPLFQGASGIESDLHMVVTLEDGTEYDRCIWDKSSYIQKQVKGSFDWTGLEAKFDHWRDYGNKGANGVYKGSTLYAKGVRTNPIKCEIPVGAKIEFYLHITKGHLNYSAKTQGNYQGTEHDGQSLWGNDSQESNLVFTGTKQWSSNLHDSEGKMILLRSDIFDVDEATKKKYGKNVMLIGCEDAMYGTEDNILYNSTGTIVGTHKIDNTYQDVDGTSRKIERTVNDKTVRWEGDNDMNDIVFMIISSYLPDDESTNVRKKRYIIEDLGSIVDWDFNDIVVDLEEKLENGNKTQKAILRHLCGTTPFELFVGPAGDEANSTKLTFTANNIPVKDYKGENHYLNFTNASKISGLQMDRDVELSLECPIPSNKWNHATNNVWIKVYPGENPIQKDEDMAPNSNTQTMHTDGAAVAVIAFPERGKVPRIIATDTDFKWTTEDDNIQKELWSTINVKAASDNATMGTVSGAGNYRVGREIILTAIPKSNEYEFVSWSDGNKEITRSFVAEIGTEIDLTATFQHIRTTNAVGAVNGSGFVINDITHLKQVIDAGYNTITVNATGVTNSNQNYHLARASERWPNLLTTDPLTYKFDGTGTTSSTIVLTQGQLDIIKESGFVIQNLNYNKDDSSSPMNYTITGVIWSKTPDTFTINLAVNIDGVDNSNDRAKAQVTTSDRGTWNASAPFGQSVFPAGKEVTLTAEPKDGYAFTHWVNSIGKEKVIKNFVKNNPITIEATSNLVAYFSSNKHSDVRTLWDNVLLEEDAIVDDNWGHQSNTDILNVFSSGDTYANTLLRVYVSKTNKSSNDFALQVRTNPYNSRIFPNSGVENYEIAPTGEYLDIPMSQEFFNALKTNNYLTICGNNITVTKIELVPGYNLMSKDGDMVWNSSAQTIDGSLIVTLSYDNGCGYGWNFSDDTPKDFSKAIIEIGAITKENGDDFQYTKPTIKITGRYNSDNYFNGETYNGVEPTTLTLDYNYSSSKQLKQVYVESDRICKFEIKRAYLTK